MRQTKGFTILELIVIITIIGILAAIGLPKFQDWLPKSRVNAAARELFTEMQLARMKAISENNDYRIDFSETDNSYSIYDDGAWVKTIYIDDKYSGIQFGSTTGLPKVTFTGDTVTFQPTGMISGDEGAVYLIPADDIGSRTDRQRKITVKQTGRVRLWRYTGSAWD